MIDRYQFLRDRRTGIGGSDVAAVLGLSKWKTPRQLWEEKTGLATNEQDSDYLHFGNVLEGVIAEEFARRNQVRVQRRNRMYRHPDHPELIGNIDRYIVGGGILECKTADKFTRHLWGEDGSDEVPFYYLVQVMHYLYVTRQRESWLAVLIGGNEYRQFEIAYDNEVAEYCAARCVEFWQDFVLTGTPPPPQFGDDLARIYQVDPGRTVNATPEIIDACRDLAEVRRQIKSYQSQEEEIAFRLKNYLGEAEILLDQHGEKLATWKQQRPRLVTTIDWETISEAADIPETLIAVYTTVTEKPGNRPLLLK